jgi:hypothetical protein
MIVPEVRRRGGGLERSSFFGRSCFFNGGSAFFAFGGGDFSDVAGFAGFGILPTLDGFASAEIFSVEVRSFLGFSVEGGSSDNVTLVVTGLLDVADCLGGDCFSLGWFSTVAGFAGDVGPVPGILGISLAD